jgi:hypothetical protein
VIPPGISLNNVHKALKAIGTWYPKGSLSLMNDDRTGGMLAVHDPDAAPALGETKRPRAKMSVGHQEDGDLLTYAMTVSGHDQQLGLHALAVWLLQQLVTAKAANYLTYSITVPPDNLEYAVTIQRVAGQTPEQRIAALEAELAELKGAPA